MKTTIRDNFGKNLSRVQSLVTTYETQPNVKGSGRKSAEVLDILRAAVVLLHASLEDVLRGVAAWKLPSAPKSVLDEIPLVDSGQHAKKLLLGDLVAHRGKSIDEVITSSVDSYLQRSNYNNSGEIASLATNVGVDVTKINAHFNALDKLMSRRHQIVHRADRKTHVKGSGDHQVAAINKNQVRDWATDVEAFVSDFLTQL